MTDSEMNIAEGWIESLEKEAYKRGPHLMRQAIAELRALQAKAAPPASRKIVCRVPREWLKEIGKRLHGGGETDWVCVYLPTVQDGRIRFEVEEP